MAVDKELLRSTQMLNFELIYVRQFVCNWAPDVAADLWPDGEPSPREKHAQDLLASAERRASTEDRKPAAAPTTGGGVPPRKPEAK
jgi:hypothetical protein